MKPQNQRPLPHQSTSILPHLSARRAAGIVSAAIALVVLSSTAHAEEPPISGTDPIPVSDVEAQRLVELSETRQRIADLENRARGAEEQVEYEKAVNRARELESMILGTALKSVREELAGIRDKQSASARKNEVIVEGYSYPATPNDPQQHQQQQQQQAPRRPTYGTLYPEGESVGILRSARARSRGKDPCKVAIRTSDETSLKGAGLTKIEVKQGSTLSFSVPVPDSRTVVLGTPELCKRIETGEVVTLILEFGESGRTTYKFEHSSPTPEFEIGVSTYFAGGANRLTDVSRASFAVFPALRAGLRLNLPTQREPAFHISASALLGGGFVVVQKETIDGASSMDDDADVQRLSLFPGGSISFGRYLEIGYAYDAFNNNHMLLFSPLSLLGATIYQSGSGK